MNERMKEKQNENKCGKAWEVIGMKNDDWIDRFARFKRLRQTDQPTDGHDLLKKCEDALKKVCLWNYLKSSRPLRPAFSYTEATAS